MTIRAKISYLLLLFFLAFLVYLTVHNDLLVNKHIKNNIKLKVPCKYDGNHSRVWHPHNTEIVTIPGYWYGGGR